MARLSPYVFSQEFDNNGDPLSGGLIYTYEAGTSTPKVTYSDSAGTVPNSNPIVLDSAGRYVAWLDSGAYKFVLKNSSGVTIATKDDIAGDTANAFGSSVVTISGNLTITGAYKNNVIISTAAATLSLPDASSAGAGFYFVVKNNSASSIVTIDPNLSETIDGGLTASIRSGQSAIVICDGASWYTMFLDQLSLFADSITATGASGVALKNSAGTVVATFGASAGTVSALAGNVTISGTASAVGSLDIAGTSTAAAVITLAEDTDNGTNKVTITPPQSIASDYTLTLPSSAGTLISSATFSSSLSSAIGVSSYFESAEQTITAAGSLSIAHGLSSTPKIVQAYLKCTTADLNYSIGDIVPIGGGNTDYAASRGVVIIPDATNLVCRYGSASPTFVVLNKTTGSGAAGITNTSWKLIIRAWA